MLDLNVYFPFKKMRVGIPILLLLIVNPQVPPNYQILYQRRGAEAACVTELFDPFQYVFLKLHIQFYVICQEN